MKQRPDATYPHAHLTEGIISAFFDVYNELHSGLREQAYERAMVLALSYRGLAVEQKAGITSSIRYQPAGASRADFVVANTVLVELKALPNIEGSHVAQTLNALRATGLPLGLILNFGPTAQIKRVIERRRYARPPAQTTDHMNP